MERAEAEMRCAKTVRGALPYHRLSTLLSKLSSSPQMAVDEVEILGNAHAFFEPVHVQPDVSLDLSWKR